VSFDLLGNGRCPAIDDGQRLVFAPAAVQFALQRIEDHGPVHRPVSESRVACSCSRCCVFQELFLQLEDAPAVLKRACISSESTGLIQIIVGAGVEPVLPYDSCAAPGDQNHIGIGRLASLRISRQISIPLIPA